MGVVRSPRRSRMREIDALGLFWKKIGFYNKTFIWVSARDHIHKQPQYSSVNKKTNGALGEWECVITPSFFGFSRRS